MAVEKKYDLAVKLTEFTDRRTGKSRNKWRTVGAVLDKGSGPFIVLDRTFNPAGMPNPDDRDNLLISMFPPRSSRDEQDTDTEDQEQPDPDFDDDIPF